MSGRDDHTKGIVADQLAQASMDFSGGMAVVGQHQNPARVFTLNPDPIGDAMHQKACLAWPRPSKDQHARGLALIADDLLLQAKESRSPW